MNVSENYFRLTGKRNLYNITVIENIPSIMRYGILSYDKTRQLYHSSIAMSDVQKRRDNIIIPGGLRLHSYANLYFTYHNPMLYKRQEMADGICILALSAEVLNLENCVVSDRNAAANLVKFFPADEGINRLNFGSIFAQNWNDPDPYKKQLLKHTKCAEVLVPESISFDYVMGAYVVSDSAKQKMLDRGFDRRLAVNSKVFYR